MASVRCGQRFVHAWVVSECVSGRATKALGCIGGQKILAHSTTCQPATALQELRHRLWDELPATSQPRQASPYLGECLCLLAAWLWDSAPAELCRMHSFLRTLHAVLVACLCIVILPPRPFVNPSALRSPFLVCRPGLVLL